MEELEAILLMTLWLLLLTALAAGVETVDLSGLSASLLGGPS